jgi:hypothetical protein
MSEKIWSEELKGIDQEEDPRVDGKIILKYILAK